MGVIANEMAQAFEKWEERSLWSAAGHRLRQKAFAEKYGVEMSTGSYEEMLKDETLM